MTTEPGRHHGHRHIELSVVVPCYNEEDSLPSLVDALATELPKVAGEL